MKRRSTTSSVLTLIIMKREKSNRSYALPASTCWKSKVTFRDSIKNTTSKQGKCHIKTFTELFLGLPRGSPFITHKIRFSFFVFRFPKVVLLMCCFLAFKILEFLIYYLHLSEVRVSKFRIFFNRKLCFFCSLLRVNV